MLRLGWLYSWKIVPLNPIGKDERALEARNESNLPPANWEFVFWSLDDQNLVSSLTLNDRIHRPKFHRFFNCITIELIARMRYFFSGLLTFSLAPELPHSGRMNLGRRFNAAGAVIRGSLRHVVTPEFNRRYATRRSC
jgi:hypothetical protein